MKKIIVSKDNLLPNRIIEFGHNKFGNKRGWKVQFQKALGLTSIQQLSNILNGKVSIGKKIIQRLVAIGADETWIQTGISKKEFDSLKELRRTNLDRPSFNLRSVEESILKEETPVYYSGMITINDHSYSLKVFDDSMQGVFDLNDVIIVSKIRKISPNVVTPVHLKLKDGTMFIRYCTIQYKNYLLTATNNLYIPLIVKKQEIEFVYPIIELRKYY